MKEPVWITTVARIMQCFIFILLLSLFLGFLYRASICLTVIAFIYFVYICYTIIRLYIIITFFMYNRKYNKILIYLAIYMARYTNQTGIQHGQDIRLVLLDVFLPEYLH